jgi:enamine deaminase RidA (YjgF/YER057c/UK114 family)
VDSVDDEGNPIHDSDIRAQLARAFDHLETVLDRAGMNLGNVVRLNYYTTDVDGLLGCFDVAGDRLSGSGTAVAGALLGVERLAIPTLLVELEATAVA